MSLEDEVELEDGLEGGLGADLDELRPRADDARLARPPLVVARAVLVTRRLVPEVQG